ncbi:MAG: AAA family ATPase [Muribaculaceae bacterium]|nr:AAA family ATPase [Muribaculaceae bacterium]
MSIRALNERREYITPELFLRELIRTPKFRRVLKEAHADIELMTEILDESLEEQGCLTEARETDDSSDNDSDELLRISDQMQELIGAAYVHTESAGRDEMDIPHVVNPLFDLEESDAAYALEEAIPEGRGEFMAILSDIYASGIPADREDYWDTHDEDDEDAYEEIIDHPASGRRIDRNSKTHDKPEDDWKSIVICLNDVAESRNPLVGRESELERTIQVLCRKDKNNPLHVGEPGVGKTALVYGLARRINEGNVPEKLKDARIYSLELGNLLAGTQYRGDFEKRIKILMEGLAKEGNAILYIDEIHNLVGAGAVGEGSMDASNMLKPYLEAGNIRFIGSTTFDEHKRYFARSRGLARRFQQIDILEPSEDEAIEILTRLLPVYEAFHGVSYTPKAVRFAVTGSRRHIHDRFLPDKAIDLLDEAGSYRQLHPGEEGDMTVDRRLIAEVLAKMCKVEALSEGPDDNTALETLFQRISANIYGQDKAIRSVTEAVMMSKAGLSDEEKPLASLLFVGPTGVGKTEVARTLARELGVELVRFDMSEFAEKHSVAKLVGAPAGYVGYDDGGLLTDAVRKTPDCVLLLDEIEKAHSDIYNILLQVMDYGRLTDSKGQKADFRNVVIIMTSNAGARYASQASVGFASKVTSGDAMMKEVKKTFKPEFLNRLSDTIIFSDMTREMASLVLDKRLRELSERLKAKNVIMTIAPEAREYLLNEGFTREYGARELDRVLHSRLKTLLMRSLLYGPLRNGGHAHIILSPDNKNLEIKLNT